MWPIFTAQNEHDLKGYWYGEFVTHFDSICQEHLETGKAKKFAFIVYDFHSPTKKVLENQGVFTELDRLSGKDITIFYLDGRHSLFRNNQTRLFGNLNNILLGLTGQHVRRIPFVVFFDFTDGDVSNLKCYSIRGNEKFILFDLANAIKEELQTISKPEVQAKVSVFSTFFKETPKIFYKEFIKLVFKGIVEHFK